MYSYTDGVPQTQGENSLNIAMDVLTLICPNITPTNIDVVYRVGNPNVSNRPILVNFTTRSLKEQVVRNKVNLRGSQNMKNVWINEDFNQTIRKQKSEARNVVNLARRKGQTIQQKGTGVVLNGIYYILIKKCRAYQMTYKSLTRRQRWSTTVRHFAHNTPHCPIWPRVSPV